MSHLDEGTLHALLDGELTLPEARAVEAHLADCAACRAVMAEARAFVRETDTLIGDLDEPEAGAPQPVATTRRSLPRLRTMGLAASLLIAAGVTYVAFTSRGPGHPEVAPLPGIVPPIAAAPDTGASADEAKTAAEPPVTGQRSADANQAGAGGREAESSVAPATPAPRDELPAEGERQEPAQASGALADRADRPANERPAEAIDAAAAAEKEEEDRVVTKKAAAVSLEVAVASLGGSIRLIDGMTPVRVDTVEGGAEVADRVVRVTYQDTLDRPVVLEQSRIAAATEQARNRASRAQAAPPAAAPAPAPAFRRLEIGPGDTVITARADGVVEIRWLDTGGFLLTLVGADRDYLLQLIPRVH